MRVKFSLSRFTIIKSAAGLRRAGNYPCSFSDSVAKIFLTAQNAARAKYGWLPLVGAKKIICSTTALTRRF
jgi:hypothetical protein